MVIAEQLRFTPEQTALTFVGQGSQFVGMGDHIRRVSPAASHVYDVAAKIVGQDIISLSSYGPLEKLTETDNTQLATFIYSHASWEALKEINISGLEDTIRYHTGSSLGWYNSLVSAGVISFEEGLWLVKQRGEAMKKACTIGPTTTLAAVLVRGPEDYEKLAAQREKHGLEETNDNSATQKIVGGPEERVDALIQSQEALPKPERLRVSKLKVAGAYHSNAMKPAEEPMKEALKQVSFRRPVNSIVIANTTGQPISQPEDLQTECIEQLTHTVKYGPSIEYLIREGVTTFIEPGQQETQTGINKRILESGHSEKIQIRDVIAATYATNLPQAA